MTGLRIGLWALLVATAAVGSGHADEELKLAWTFDTGG